MIKFNKKGTKAFGIRIWWTNYIYLIPTIMIVFYLIKNDALMYLDVGHDIHKKGNSFILNVYFLGFVISIEYWWNMTDRKIK